MDKESLIGLYVERGFDNSDYFPEYRHLFEYKHRSSNKVYKIIHKGLVTYE